MRAREVWFPTGATQRDWVVDGILAVSLALVSIVPYVQYAGTGAPWFFLVGLSLVTVLPVALRRHAPLVMLVLVAIGCTLQLVAFPAPTPSLFAIPVVAYTVARWVPGYASRSVVVVGAFASILGPLRWFGMNSSGNPSTDILYWGACMGAVLTPYAIGRRSREVAKARQNEIRIAEERYQLLLAEREQQSRLAEASTRTMIARELHDIVAHSLSVMIVQAEGGKALARKKPEVAEQALTTIAETGRESLYEMRRIVGVLRGGPDARADFAPAPSLRDIPDLVTRASEHARLEVYGEPVGTSPALEVTVYRIVQEGLTNFLKHAGAGAEASVILTYSPSQVSVEVVDNGHGVPDPTEGGGNGIRGMQERVTSMGGTITAGPRDDGPGFRVYARIPVRTPYERLAEPPETGDPR